MMNALPLLKVFAAGCAAPGFFGLPTWYEYLNMQVKNGVCQVVYSTGANGTPPTATDFFGSFILIGLAVIDILLHIGGVVAVGFVIYGGIQYVTSRGEPDKTAKAQGTVLNALIGLAITILAIALVSFFGSELGK